MENKLVQCLFLLKIALGQQVTQFVEKYPFTERINLISGRHSVGNDT